MTKEDLENAAMEIILNAGNARFNVMNALDYIKDENCEDAQVELRSARESITLAHQAQTVIIQKMISEENIYSILFNHAQDTLMTVMSEVNLSEKMISIFETIDKKMGAIK